jgi:hypothetical protein
MPCPGTGRLGGADQGRPVDVQDLSGDEPIVLQEQNGVHNLVGLAQPTDRVQARLHPYTVGRPGVVEHYDSQPLGMVADYGIQQTRRLGDDPAGRSPCPVATATGPPRGTAAAQFLACGITHRNARLPVRHRAPPAPTPDSRVEPHASRREAPLLARAAFRSSMSSRLAPKSASAVALDRSTG